jgi:ubiquinone biosynthesis protein COQ9
MSVYLPAIMFFIADSSKEHQETDGFITNSLERIVNFASMARNFKIPPLADLPIFRMFL